MKDEALRLALEALESHIVWFSRDTMIGKAMRKKAEDSITAIKQALEQPEPEPVAWMNKHGACMSAVFKQVDATAGEYTTPLYTSPPKREWQGLTDDEYSQLHDGLYQQGKSLGWVVDQIEEKLKERNL